VRRRRRARPTRHAPDLARWTPPRRGLDAPPRGAQGLRDAVRASSFTARGTSATRSSPCPKPGRGELVLRIDAALTCRHRREDAAARPSRDDPRIPTVFGHELAGTVALWEPGSALRRGRPRRRGELRAVRRLPLCLAGRPISARTSCSSTGPYGEFIALPPRLVAKNVVPLGRSLPAARAAFAEPLACALLGIERRAGRVRPDGGGLRRGAARCLLGLCAAARKARVLLVGKAGWRLESRARAELGIGELPRRDGNGRHRPGTFRAKNRRARRRRRGGRDGAARGVGGGRGRTSRGGSVVFFGGCAPGTSIRWIRAGRTTRN